VPDIVAPQAGIELTATIIAVRELLHVIALVIEHHLKPDQGEGIVLIGSWWWREVCGVGDGREREREREREEKTNRYLHTQW
jgi:hypothetical protein